MSRDGGGGGGSLVLLGVAGILDLIARKDREEEEEVGRSYDMNIAFYDHTTQEGVRQSENTGSLPC